MESLISLLESLYTETDPEKRHQAEATLASAGTIILILFNPSLFLDQDKLIRTLIELLASHISYPADRNIALELQYLLISNNRHKGYKEGSCFVLTADIREGQFRC